MADSLDVVDGVKTTRSVQLVCAASVEPAVGQLFVWILKSLEFVPVIVYAVIVMADGVLLASVAV